MVKKRVIPCLDVAGGRVVKGVNFRDLREMGEPGARELVRLRERTSYQHPRRKIDAALAALARDLRIPLGALEDAMELAFTAGDTEFNCLLWMPPTGRVRS